MDNIIEPNETFDFSKITLSNPVGIQGGAYFTKINYNNKPLYIQSTKSLTRQGVVKTGKKYYCDLMFDNNSEILINWFENLEEKCQKLIFDKSESWFQNALEISDIESAFNSIIKVYKSGKYYLVRTNVKQTVIKIYNENEIPLNMEDIQQETNVISILEIQGIKFTARNFQFEIELKQVMVLNTEKIFDNCLIKTNANKKVSVSTNDIALEKRENDSLSLEKDVIPEIEELETKINENNHLSYISENSLQDIEVDIPPDLINNLINNDVILNENLNENEKNENSENSEKISKKEENILNIEMEELNNSEIEDINDLKEIELDLNLESNLEAITLKKPNQVYFELYKEAKNKAKQAKKSAILAYLEAKNIKKTYMLENVSDSDSDSDFDFENISESEQDYS
jgi:rRNA-processing protein FCF1